MHLNQSCRKFDEMPLIHLKLFCNCLVDGVGQNVYLNQSCRKFDEMPKSTKYFFSLFGQLGKRVG